MAGWLCVVLTSSRNLFRFRVYVDRYCMLDMIVSSSLLYRSSYFLIIILVSLSLLQVIVVVSFLNRIVSYRIVSYRYCISYKLFFSSVFKGFVCISKLLINLNKIKK
jgi:hypothetical protein